MCNPLTPQHLHCPHCPCRSFPGSPGGDGEGWGQLPPIFLDLLLHRWLKHQKPLAKTTKTQGNGEGQSNARGHQHTSHAKEPTASSSSSGLSLCPVCCPHRGPSPQLLRLRLLPPGVLQLPGPLLHHAEAVLRGPLPGGHRPLPEEDRRGERKHPEVEIHAWQKTIAESSTAQAIKH